MKHVKLAKAAAITLATFALVASATGAAFAGSGAGPVGDADASVPAAALGQLIAVAKTDLASRLGVPTSALTLKSATRVIWRNSSLGCPKRGLMNLEVMTPGYLIVLTYQGRDHEYHGDIRGPLFMCESAKATRLAP